MKIKNSLSLLTVFALSALTAGAQVALNVWNANSSYTGSGGGSYTFGTTNFAVGSINSAAGHQAVCTYLNAKSDLSSSVVSIWTDYNTSTTNPPAYAVVSNSTVTITLLPKYDSTGTNNVGGNTNGLIVGNPVVIRHLANDNYEPRIVATVTATNFTLNAAPTTAIVQGDLVYPMALGGTITCGATTLALGPGGTIAAGSPNTPLLLSVNFTSAGAIQFASGQYQ